MFSLILDLKNYQFLYAQKLIHYYKSSPIALPLEFLHIPLAIFQIKRTSGLNTMFVILYILFFIETGYSLEKICCRCCCSMVLKVYLYLPNIRNPKKLDSLISNKRAQFCFEFSSNCKVDRELAVILHEKSLNYHRFSAH